MTNPVKIIWLGYLIDDGIKSGRIKGLLEVYGSLYHFSINLQRHYQFSNAKKKKSKPTLKLLQFEGTAKEFTVPLRSTHKQITETALYLYFPTFEQVFQDELILVHLSN